MDTYIIRPWEQRYVGQHRKPKITGKIIRRAVLFIGGMILATAIGLGQ